MKLLILLIGGGWMYVPAQTLSVTPASPAVRQQQTLQFTANKAVTWSLAPGSAGSISPDGLYAAPSNVTVKQKVGPCQLLPPDHIFNTRVDSLPLHPSNAALMGLFTGQAATLRIFFSPSFGTNVITNDVPTTDMKFVYTSANNGLFQIPEWPTFPDLKVESGVFVRPFQSPGASNFDRHMISVNRETCAFEDLYNVYQVGDNPVQCATCNAQSGVQYKGVEFVLPTSGATDAAGMAQQPVSLRLSDILSGEVRHALRFTLPNGYIRPAYIWPATANAFPYCTGGVCWEYGMYVRLKNSFDISGYSPISQMILTGLKRYGMILTDGGSTWDIQTNTDVMLIPSVRAALGEISGSIIGKDNLEVLDTMALKIANNSGAVSLANNYVTPTQYAEVIATDAQMNTARVRIALEGVTVGVSEQAMTIAAGHQVQLSAWVKGTDNEAVSWSMSPEVGTLTAEGEYTAPSSVNAPTAVTFTATSAADPSATGVIQATIWPFDDQSIRIDAGGTGDFTDSNGKIWYRDGHSQFESGLTGIWNDPSGWPGGTPSYYFQSRYHYADSTYKWYLPNGNYRITLHMGIGFGTGPINPADYKCHLESQGQLARRSYGTAQATGGARRVPGSVSIPMMVTNGFGYFAQRHLDGANHFCNVAAIEIKPDPASPHIEIDAPETGEITIGQTRQFYAVGWYMSNAVSWAITSGPGTIDANGLYTAPSTPPSSTQTVTLRATSTEDPAQWAEVSFSFAFGTLVISPQTISVPRGLVQQFTAKIGGVAYTNVTWTVSPSLGTIGASGLFTAPSSLGADTPVLVTVTSNDDPAVSATASVTLLRSIQPIRVNCGGTLLSQGFTDSGGRAWAVDNGYSAPSQSYSEGVPIQNTTADMYPLYQSSRYRYRGETFSYKFPVPVGNYRVTLKWAEYRPDDQGLKMDVKIEDVTVLTNFNPTAVAGWVKIALDRTFSVLVTDGEINLTFIGKADSGYLGAAINGIEIVEETPAGAASLRGAARLMGGRLQ